MTGRAALSADVLPERASVFLELQLPRYVL
jgi:hypothetical protein